MTKPLISFARLGSSSSNAQHEYHEIIEPALFQGKDLYTDRSVCGMDLSRLEFQVLNKNSVEDESVLLETVTTDELHTNSLDVLVFPTPPWCAEMEESCDLSPLGIGSIIPGQDGEMSWELCDDGKIQVSGLYKGYHSSIPIPTVGSMDPHVNHGLIAPFELGGRVYRTIFANCATNSRPVQISGTLQLNCVQHATPASLAAQDRNESISYALVSLLVFVICVLCTIRIQFCPHQINGYEEAPRSEADV